MPLGLLVYPSPSRAELPRPAIDRAADRFVVLDIDGSPDPEFEETLRELLQRNSFRLVHPGVVTIGQIFASVRIGLHDTGATVLVTDGRGQSPPVLREVDGSDSPALFRETLAHIILGAVEPLAATEPDPDEVGAPVESPPAGPTPPLPVPEGPRRLSLSVGYKGGPLLVAAHQAGVSFGLGGTVTLESAWRPSATFEAAYMVPVRITGNDEALDAQVGLVPLRFRAGIEPFVGRSVSLETALAAGVDLLTLSPSSSDPLLRPSPETKRLQPMFGASVSGRGHLLPSIDVVLSLGLDVDLAPRRWVVVDDADRRLFFETARFRPYASVGMTWTLPGKEQRARTAGAL